MNKFPTSSVRKLYTIQNDIFAVYSQYIPATLQSLKGHVIGQTVRIALFGNAPPGYAFALNVGFDALLHQIILT